MWSVSVGQLIAQEALDEKPVEEAPVDVEAAPPAETPNFETMTAREFFEMIDFGPSYLEAFIDFQPQEGSEQEAVIRALTRIRRLQPHRITRWLKLEAPWAELAANPEEHRLEIYLLIGNVTAVREKVLPAEAVERVGLSSYYEVDLALDDSKGEATATIVVEDIPRAWKVALDPSKNVIGQPVSCPGVFLKALSKEGAKPDLLFATPKISWHPSKPNAALGVTSAIVRLSQQGMDISELSQIRDRTKFEGMEREPFYQMMTAVSRMPFDEQTPTVGQSVSELMLLPKDGLMVAPEKYRGEFLHLSGLCRRITRIEIDDEDIRDRFGIDHYFELSIFVPIPAPIVSQRPGDEESRREFSNDYPVLVCVPNLPQGLAVGDQLHASVQVTGAFFKLWAYRTPFMSRGDYNRRQISPLLIAASVQNSTGGAGFETNQFAMAMLIILIIVVGMGIALGILFARKPASRRR
ncbi:hypothetical protein GC197_05810 [bacterium]|nr:hypothetical protein [bacterium]